MSVPMDQGDNKPGEDIKPAPNPENETINPPKIMTVKVTNVALAALEEDVKEFFSFSGEIHFIELQRESETTQLAYVTFNDPQGVDAALLLSGAFISNLSVSIVPAENYQLPPHAPPLNAPSAAEKAGEVASTVLAKGFIFGKDALKKAKSFDERHQLTSNASAAVASIDRKMGLTEKLSIGTVVVGGKAREMNDRYQMSEKAKVAMAAAEQTASTAGTALASNRYVSGGASWFSVKLNAVAKAASVVSALTVEKVKKAEEEKWENITKERAVNVNDLAQVHLDQSSFGDVPAAAAASDSSSSDDEDDSKKNKHGSK
ncbi:binding partner of ACD11 1-like isoform X1 [Ipomoea triloba]|uniref:binding partner of ACD11 1-like isoform X1 n=2 Tax=Ipomoea triloba TaxID=35885 RepID=UPI00125CEE5B|nr:binding partner of ACD11 1-like isoform X1 [Ipomoea triloba]